MRDLLQISRDPQQAAGRMDDIVCRCPSWTEPYQSQSCKLSETPPRHAASLAMIDNDSCCNLWRGCWRLRKRYVRDLLNQGSILLTQILQARRTAASQPAGRVLT